MIGVPLKPRSLNNIGRGDHVLITEGDIGFLDVEELVNRGCNIVITGGAAELIAKEALGVQGLEMLGLSKQKPLMHSSTDVTAFRYRDRVIVLEHRRPMGWL